MGIDGGRAAGGVTLAIVLVLGCILMFGGLLAVEGIESSRADRAMAKASAEQARAGAVAAQAQARVDEVEIEADRDVQMQLDQQAHELVLLREENRQFQERMVFFATAISNMEREDVSALQRWLGSDKVSVLDIVLAALMAGVAFLLFIGLWPVLKTRLSRRLEGIWTT